MATDLNDLLAFSKVAHYRSFRRAAQELQVTASALSHTISKMEQALGMRLLQRTTRSVSPSPAGEKLLQSLQPALHEIESALESLNELRDKPVGRLRLNVPRPAAQLLLAPMMAAWQATYPEVELEIVSSDALIDIVEQGFDAGLRFGESLQQDMVAVPVGPEVRFVTCASPAYLAAHGLPQTPHDLLQHQCIQFRFPSGLRYRWEYQRGQEKLQVATTGTLVFDDFYVATRAAADGAGICYTYCGYAEELVRQGRLQYVLDDWWPAPERSYLYYSSRRHQSAALRALIDFLK
ncbi:LysR family transcriptional regulator [Undibacterium sp. TS12]|uniref:LysR family transcriptional regulator n=1 Tax=Undibacterium sp. TS12 TaxID=2908202 RepID=UPI001F4D171F|nr:LysR family transcriptional regulator [Undibacterium sp. TS12]MCH8618253.1 LysR family transcriptional regulator [Undibacterium sp. TS12]